MADYTRKGFIDGRSARLMTVTVRPGKPNGPAISLPLHRAVLDAVIARSPDKAERAVLRLIDSARDDIEMVLNSKKKLPSLSHPAPSLRAPRGLRHA